MSKVPTSYGLEEQSMVQGALMAAHEGIGDAHHLLGKARNVMTNMGRVMPTREAKKTFSRLLREADQLSQLTWSLCMLAEQFNERVAAFEQEALKLPEWKPPEDE